MRVSQKNPLRNCEASSYGTSSVPSPPDPSHSGANAYHNTWLGSVRRSAISTARRVALGGGSAFDARGGRGATASARGAQRSENPIDIHDSRQRQHRVTPTRCAIVCGTPQSIVIGTQRTIQRRLRQGARGGVEKFGTLTTAGASLPKAKLEKHPPNLQSIRSLKSGCRRAPDRWGEVRVLRRSRA